jgi:transposase
MSKTRPSEGRLRVPDRSQVSMALRSADELVDADHPVRVVWAVVCRLDLGGFYAAIRARDGAPGRDATDPRLLVALWLYAATDGVGSARGLARLCVESAPYAWLCGGVSLNHHTLSDFRVGHGEALDGLLTQVIAALVGQGLVTVHRVAQDGTRVRACAGAGGFRRKATLAKLLAEARAHVAELRALVDDPDRSAGLSARRKAAMARAAREREGRVEAAVAQLPALEARQAKLAERVSGKDRAAGKLREPRASTTDAEARVMRMPDGGYRPAVNVQLAVDTASRAVVGVDVVADGNDYGRLVPMREQVERRAGRRVNEHLADGGYLTLDDVAAAAAAGVTLYVPPKPPRNAGARGSEFDPRPTDPAEARAGVARADGVGRRQGGLRGTGGHERDGQRGPEVPPRARAADRPRAGQGQVRRAVVRAGVQPDALRGAVAARVTRDA